MPVREQASMGSTAFRAYSRRRKVKKEELGEKTSPVQDQVAGCDGFKRGHCDEPAKRLLSLELDVAEALADFWRMAHRPPQQHGFLQWSRKRKRSASRNKDFIPPLQPKEEPEDALSTVKKNRSACALGRDSCASDRDEIDSVQCSKESSSLIDSRAQSPSSPLPSMQLPCGTFLDGGRPDVKSAFQRVIPLAPCLLTVKTEIEDIHSERSAGGLQQMSVRQKSKVCKPMGLKTTVKTESVDEYGAACLEEMGVKPVAAAVHKVAGLVLLKKPKCALTEMEKEARRLRRIQANRESARQTIRKKQVLCEQLTKKASTLVLENEDMKQKRDLLLRELFSLKGQNQNLKRQLETRSSGILGHDLVESPLKILSDPACVPALQVSRLPYAGAPPPAFFWAMAAAAAAAAANQAYSLNQQETWDASSAVQHEKASLALAGLRPHNQTIVSEVVEQRVSRASSGDGSPTLTVPPQVEGGSPVGVCTKSCILPKEEAHHDSLHEAAHPAKEFASRDLIDKSACDFSGQAGCLLPQPTAASNSELSSLPGILMNAESMDYVMGPHIVQGVACGYMYGGNVAGYFKGNAHVTATKGRNYYTAMVAAEARRRRKELTRSKFSRPRAVKPAAVS